MLAALEPEGGGRKVIGFLLWSEQGSEGGEIQREHYGRLGIVF